MKAKNHYNMIRGKSLAFLLIFTMCAWLWPWNLMEVQAEAMLNDPQVTVNSSTGNAEKTTWDCVWFGNYKQNSDGDGGFKREPIKWRVLFAEGNNAFLIADRNLACQTYNETQTAVTWETCTLRSWLNNDFINEAFNSEEQQAIQATHMVNGNNPTYGTKGGNDTTDRIYLLSIEEAEKAAYGFSANGDTNCAKNTDYAKAQGAYTDNSSGCEGNGQWWLRSPGCDSGRAACVSAAKYVYRYGNGVSNNISVVRPALHLNLDSNLWSYAGTVSSDGAVSEKVPTYKISYDANGGTGAPPTQTKTYDQTLSLSSALPTRTGYDFLGWSESKSAGTATYKAGDGYINNSNATLYAVWKEQPKANGSQGSNTSKKGKMTQIISASSKTLTYKGKSVSLKAKTSGDGKLSYSSSNEKIAAVSSAGTVTPKECGTAKITIMAAETGKYKAAKKTITVKVNLKQSALRLKRIVGSSTATLSWVKVSGASGYQVSTYDVEKKKTKLKKTKQRTTKARMLRKGKKYQFKVRAYRKVGKKTIYGPYSKGIKIKW